MAGVCGVCVCGGGGGEARGGGRRGGGEDGTLNGNVPLPHSPSLFQCNEDTNNMLTHR